MGSKSKANPLIHITSTASNTVFDDCEFVDISLKNDGKQTMFLKTKFLAVTHNLFQKGWHTTWWGGSLITIVCAVIPSIILYFVFGIGKTNEGGQEKIRIDSNNGIIQIGKNSTATQNIYQTTSSTLPTIDSIIISIPSKENNGLYNTQFLLTLKGSPNSSFDNRLLFNNRKIFSSCSIFSDGRTSSTVNPSGNFMTKEIYIDCTSSTSVTTTENLFRYGH